MADKKGDKPEQQIMDAALEVEAKAKTEEIIAFWKDSIESMSGQIDHINALIQRANESSIESARITSELNTMKHPTSTILEDFKVDKKTEKLIDSQGAFIGVLSQVSRIIKEKIADKLDNPPEEVDTPTLATYWDKYLPKDIESHMPNLDSFKKLA